MASLTPLSKGLIGLVVIGCMASAVWHLYLKERVSASQVPASPVNAPLPPRSEPVSMAPVTPTAPPAPSAVLPQTTPQPAAQPRQGSAEENFENGRKSLAGGDYIRARSQLEQALQQGSAGAACLLGEMTLKGQGGITADQAKAAQLFQLAQSRNTICFTAGH